VSKSCRHTLSELTHGTCYPDRSRKELCCPLLSNPPHRRQFPFSSRIPSFIIYYCHHKLDSLFYLALPHSFHCRDSSSVAPVAELASLQDPTATPDGDFQHPRIASILGVHKRYRFPLLLCRGFSICPSLLGLSRCVYAIWRSSNGQEFVCVELELWLAAVWVSGFLSAFQIIVRPC
jgi:hypothetical protein